MDASPTNARAEGTDGQSNFRETQLHPFKNTQSLLEIIPNRIDVEEEERFYQQFCGDEDQTRVSTHSRSPPRGPPSVFSHDIWLGDNSGESLGFARDINISGWTSVGDKRGGAYIVYDCVVRTKEGTIIHALKRYSSFAHLYSELRRTLPRSQQPFVPTLPPKSSIAKFRPTFLDRRRRLLQQWLSAVLLHPDIGGCSAVRKWIME